MARIIVNDFTADPARGGRGRAPTPAVQIAMGVREFAANDTTLRFLRLCTGKRAAARTSPARNPARTFGFTGAEQANSPASPLGTAGTCRKGEFPSAGRNWLPSDLAELSAWLASPDQPRDHLYLVYTFHLDLDPGLDLRCS